MNLLETADARVERLRAGLRRWRLPAIAAGLALALWSTGTMVLIDRDRARAAAIRQTTETLLRDTFIPDGPILDIRLQVSRRRAQIGAAAAGDGDGPAPIELFRRAAARIDGGGVALQSVRYRTQTGLEAALTSPDFARVDALAEALRADGLRVVVLEAQADEGGTVRARLRLEGA